MTTFALVAGMLPMALGTASVRVRLGGIIVIGGQMLCLLLTLLPSRSRTRCLMILPLRRCGAGWRQPGDALRDVSVDNLAGVVIVG
jgi:hypothetical protein